MSTVTPTGASLLSSLRPEARHAPESPAMQVPNHGFPPKMAGSHQR